MGACLLCCWLVYVPSINTQQLLLLSNHHLGCSQFCKTVISNPQRYIIFDMWGVACCCWLVYVSAIDTHSDFFTQKVTTTFWDAHNSARRLISNPQHFDILSLTCGRLPTVAVGWCTCLLSTHTLTLIRATQQQLYILPCC